MTDSATLAQVKDCGVAGTLRNKTGARAVDCSQLSVRHNLKPGEKPNVTAHSICLFFADHLKAALIKQQHKAGQGKT